jgi:hypothetical protein
VRKRRDQRHHDFLYLFLSPVEPRLLAFAEDVLKILAMFDELADDSDAEGVVHGFVEEVTVVLDDVLVVLSLIQLHGLLLVLVQLVQ